MGRFQDGPHGPGLTLGVREQGNIHETMYMGVYFSAIGKQPHRAIGGRKVTLV